MRKSISLRIMIILITMSVLMLGGAIVSIVANVEMRRSSNDIIEKYIRFQKQQKVVVKCIGEVELYTAMIPDSDSAAYVMNKNLESTADDTLVELDELTIISKKIEEDETLDLYNQWEEAVRNHVSNQSICQWERRLLPCLGYYKWCCYDHWGADLLEFELSPNTCPGVGLLGRVATLFAIF